jgi:hypothetical protein
MALPTYWFLEYTGAYVLRTQIEPERSLISMRRPSLSKPIVVLLLLLTFPGQILAGSEGYKQEVDGYHVELVFATEQPQTGSNELAIKLHDPHGQPLNGAIVQVSVAQPASAPPGEAIIDDHNPIQVNDHDEASAAGNHAAEMGHQTMLDEAYHSPTDADTHDQTSAHEANPDSHTESGSLDSGGSEIGHHGEAENSATQLTAGPAVGHYTGQVDFVDMGAWLVTVNFAVEDDVKEANFVVEAIRNTSHRWVINGFLGINAMAIVVAALMKRKPVETRNRKGIS